jgi:prepilin-type N-terminal cleavage/methylation domain-containing protein
VSPVAPSTGHDPKRGRTEAGVTLVEIMIALAILSVVLISMSGLMFQVSLQTRRAATLGYLSAAVQMAQTRVEGLPWDSLGSFSAIGCTTDTTGQLVYTRCTSVRGHPVFDTIRVVLTPTGALTAPPETVTVYRASPRVSSPFLP